MVVNGFVIVMVVLFSILWKAVFCSGIYFLLF